MSVAKPLADYGLCGIVAVLLIAVVALYRDHRALEKEMRDKVCEALAKSSTALQQINDAVRQLGVTSSAIERIADRMDRQQR